MTVTLAERPASLAHEICAHEQGEYSPPSGDDVNPVVESAEYAIKVISYWYSVHITTNELTYVPIQATDVIGISDSGVKVAAQYVGTLFIATCGFLVLSFHSRLIAKYAQRLIIRERGEHTHSTCVRPSLIHL